MGAAASLVSEDQRESLYISVLEALPPNVYALEERRFKTGSFYETTEFSPHRKHCCPVFAALGLHEWSVSMMWRHFRRMNATSSGAVTLWEFREYFALPDDNSTTRLFRCFDEDRNNRIGFLELVVGLWTYCCNCNASAMCLCFDLYDVDHNGQISLPEADFMIEEIFGAGWASKDEAKVVHAWLHERDDALLGHPELDVDAWAAFVSANLRIQGPAIRTRLVLQTKVMGVGFWTYCIRKSVRIYLGRSVTVETLLSAHMSQAVLEELAQDRNPGTDHDDSTQFTLRVLRRTGPFPRRRKFRDLGGKKMAISTADARRFKALTVRETFDRLTVPAGQDATWEEPKAPSALQALMASLANVGERCPLDRSAGAAAASNSPWAYKQKKGKPSSNKHNNSSATKTGPPEALALLSAHPGIDGEPLGSPAAAAAAAGAAAGTPGAAEGVDPAIANAFSGLQPLPELPKSSASKGGRGFRGGGGRRGKITPRGGAHAARAGGLGVPLAEGGGARPSTAEGKAVGGGREALARAGRELTLAGQMRPVGRGTGGGGAGGQGALSTRLY